MMLVTALLLSAAAGTAALMLLNRRNSSLVEARSVNHFASLLKENGCRLVTARVENVNLYPWPQTGLSGLAPLEYPRITACLVVYESRTACGNYKIGLVEFYGGVRDWDFDDSGKSLLGSSILRCYVTAYDRFNLLRKACPDLRVGIYGVGDSEERRILEYADALSLEPFPLPWNR